MFKARLHINILPQFLYEIEFRIKLHYFLQILTWFLNFIQVNFVKNNRDVIKNLSFRVKSNF
jgi:hypothetical protein